MCAVCGETLPQAHWKKQAMALNYSEVTKQMSISLVSNEVSPPELPHKVQALLQSYILRLSKIPSCSSVNAS